MPLFITFSRFHFEPCEGCAISFPDKESPVLYHSLFSILVDEAAQQRRRILPSLLHATRWNVSGEPTYYVKSVASVHHGD